MPDITFYDFELGPFGQPVWALLIEKQAPFERIVVGVKSEKPAWFVELSPTASVPTLKVGDTVLFESLVICEYLDETFAPRLHPADPLARARHRAWMSYAGLLLQDWFPVMTETDEGRYTGALTTYDRRLERLERELGAGPWFAGAQPCLVDFAFMPLFVRQQLLEERFGFRGLDAFPRIARWSEAVLARPSTRSTIEADFGDRIGAWLLATNAVVSRKGQHA